MQAERRTSPSIERSVIDLVRGLAPEGRPVRPGDRLASIGLDSLACADLAIAVEERFGVRLPDADILPLETVQQVIAAATHGVKAKERLRKDLGRLQDVVAAVVGPFIRLYARMRIVGAENVPLTGPVVIASNHRSMFDVPALVVACPRRVFFMAKQELYGDPARARIWAELGGFPVRRQIADIRSIDTALALLEREEAVAVYPEGTRNKTGEMLPFLLGAAWLALRTGAPVVPCGLIGTGVQPGWDGNVAKWRGKHVRVSFGEPLAVEREPDPRERRRKAELMTERIREGIAERLT